jgi:hypothetical protein
MSNTIITKHTLSREYGMVFTRSRKNATTRNIPFDITREEFNALVEESKGFCMVSGMPFNHLWQGRGTRRPFAPSLDRIDSKIGYTKENCRMVCIIVNLALNDWGIYPLEIMAEAIVAKKTEVKAKPEPNRGLYTVNEFLDFREDKLVSAKRLTNWAARYCKARSIDIGARVVRVRENADGTIATKNINTYPLKVLDSCLQSIYKNRLVGDDG